MKTLDLEKHYYSIGEVSSFTGIKPYILRYWEKEFGLIRPMRRESGQRKFTRKDLDLISQIKELLYDKGYSIRGAKKYLWAQSRKGQEQLKIELEDAPVLIEVLKESKKEIQDILRILKSH